MSDLTKWCSKLQCGVLSFSYDFRRRKAQLLLPAGHCVDMQGCLDFVRSIGPDVRLVETYCYDEDSNVHTPDTSYRWVAPGTWLPGMSGDEP